MLTRARRLSETWVVAAFLTVTLAGCGGGDGLDDIQLARPIDPDLIANPPPGLPEDQDGLDLSQRFGGVPLDMHVPVLTVDESFDLAVLAAGSTAPVDWSVPDEGDGLFLRVAETSIAPDSCPTGGTPADSGVAGLDALDGFDHPLRRIHTPPIHYLTLDTSAPTLSAGSIYSFQGCVIDTETGWFTGDGTNIVTVEIASALPDLVVREIRALGRSSASLGRLFIRVADLNAAMEREIRSETFDYRVSIPGADPPVSYVARTRLRPDGSAWIIAGAETPSDFSDDPRIPDDGRTYDVAVYVNGSRLLPEANYHNNSLAAELRARPRPLVFGIDRVIVNQDCDGVSPGDWLMLLELRMASDFRIVADGTVDVDDGTTYRPRWGFLLAGTHLDTQVRARLGFVDCDWFSPFFTGFVVPFAGPFWSVDTMASSCGGEEFHEIGGYSDLVGWTNGTLSGVTDSADVTVRSTASEEQCGDSPYTVEFKLMTREQASDQGYTILATIGR